MQFGIVNHKQIDDINILNATKLALTNALSELSPKPDIILVDALTKINTLGIPYISVVKGDANIYSIAAASIIAKVTRDRIMLEWDSIYPAYGFAKHKGYPTKAHLQALQKYGIIDGYRLTYGPVAKLKEEQHERV